MRQAKFMGRQVIIRSLVCFDFDLFHSHCLVKREYGRIATQVRRDGANTKQKSTQIPHTVYIAYG